MEPFFAMPDESRFSPEERELMLEAAADAVEYGLHRHSVFPVIPARFPPSLQQPGACFVTLERDRQLRGCIGTLNAYRPLIEDIVENAYSASRNDTRFEPIEFAELPDLAIHLSILNEPEPMPVRDEVDFATQLRPGVDGAILETSGKRGTFLPAVWEQCRDVQEFVSALKRKAGIAADDWPDDVRVYRYTVESIG